MAVGISNILALLGGVALFLFGMGLMGDSLKLVAGGSSSSSTGSPIRRSRAYCSAPPSPP